MKKLFFWIVFWVAIHFMRTGEMYDLWSNVTAGAMSAGILPVAWYLFTYCLIMLLGYPLWHLMKKYPYLFVSLSLMWGILLAFDFGREFLSSKPQSLWLHLYIGYFCIGMSLHIVLGRLRELLKLKGSIILSIALCVVATIIYAFKVKTEKVPLFPHNYYGRWFYSIWLISLFWICSLVIINGKWQAKLLKKLSENTFVVYLGHMPVLLYITADNPLDTTLRAAVYIIALFVGLEAFAEVFRRMPLLRKLV